MTDKRYVDKFCLGYTKMVKACEHLYGNAHPSDVISALRAQGMHQHEIAAHLGVSLSTVRQWQKPQDGGTIYDAEHSERSRQMMIDLNARIKRGEIKRSSPPWRNQRLFVGSR